MAKPIQPTPIVSKSIARQIQKEIRNGTPDTPQRIATIRRADEAFLRDIVPLLNKRGR